MYICTIRRLWRFERLIEHPRMMFLFCFLVWHLDCNLFLTMSGLISHRSYINLYNAILRCVFLNPQLFSTKKRMWTKMVFFAEVYASQTILNSMPLSILGYFKKVTSPVACRGDGGWPNFIISAIFHNFGRFHNFSQISQSWNTWNTWNT